MTDSHKRLGRLKRPRLLIRAARFGLVEYDRDRDLKRLMGTPTAPPPSKAVPALLSEEEDLEQTRQTGGGDYSVARHIEILVAIMGEARLLPKPAVKP